MLNITKSPKMAIRKLKINNETESYRGKPLKAFCLDSDAWSGRSNFQASNESEPTESLKNLSDAFHWMRQWKEESDYIAGYVIDFAAMVIYYDNHHNKISQLANRYNLKKVQVPF